MFRYDAFAVDADTGVARFGYRLDDAVFEEVVEIPVPARRPSAGVRDEFTRVVELAYLVAGTSYYKTAAPPTVVAAQVIALADGARPFLRDVYRHGMAEFAYRNDLDHVLDLEPDLGPPRRDTPVVRPPDPDAPPLVPVGGGKDSIVSLETLRKSGHAPVLFAVNPNAAIEKVVAAAGLPALYARRRIDPRLFDLNARGALNGHVPVTAINSLIAVATSVLHGLGPVIMSNERSASTPNVVWHGRDINHQWSKGIDAETGLRAALRAHAGLSDRYFSLLRPFSELHIARMFAHLTAYDHVVTSCNGAFRLTRPGARWCADCPKCRFIFLALAPFMDRGRLVGIFGTDMLADLTQLPGYRELAGLAEHRPFECVGEIDESLVALRLLLADGSGWRDAPVVRALAAEVPPDGWPDPDAPFTPSGPDFIPAPYRP